jgi:antitoxin component of MazEF toxin-antitoxin module
MSDSDPPTSFPKTIIRHGNSTSIYLPKLASYFGFPHGTPIDILVEPNKLTIVPKNSQSFKSHLKHLVNKKVKLHATFQKNAVSPRFEDKYHFRNEFFTLILSFDHVENKHLLLYLNRKTKTWTVSYITETVFSEIKNGKNPENFLLVK